MRRKDLPCVPPAWIVPCKRSRSPQPMPVPIDDQPAPPSSNEPLGTRFLSPAGRDRVGELDRLRRDLDDPHVGHVHRARLGEPDLQTAGRAYVAGGAEHGLVLLPRRAHRELGEKPAREPALGLLDRHADRAARQARGSHPAGELIQAILDQVDLAVLGQHGVAVAALALTARADQPWQTVCRRRLSRHSESGPRWPESRTWPTSQACRRLPRRNRRWRPG